MIQCQHAFAFTACIYPECVMVCCKEHFVLIRRDGTSERFRYDEFEAGDRGDATGRTAEERPCR